MAKEHNALYKVKRVLWHDWYIKYLINNDCNTLSNSNFRINNDLSLPFSLFFFFSFSLQLPWYRSAFLLYIGSTVIFYWYCRSYVLYFVSVLLLSGL